MIYLWNIGYHWTAYSWFLVIENVSNTKLHSWLENSEQYSHELFGSQREYAMEAEGISVE